MNVDQLVAEISDYVVSPPPLSEEAYETIRLSLFDAVGCGLLALRYAECRARLAHPLVGPRVSPGARVPGTSLSLTPEGAAFAIGALNRWLDYNDTWLALEWGHPSDNFAAILAIADLVNQEGTPLSLRDALTAAIQAYEIQGVLALSAALNRVGFDHVWFVKVASAAVAAKLLGGGRAEVASALTHAFVDGGPLRTYRHAPNTGPRKSWAAGDAARRAVWLAKLAVAGEPPIPRALSTPTWGFDDVILRGTPLALAQPLGSYVAENVLFKIAFPAEFHGQTAVEAAIRLFPEVKDRWDEIARIEIRTQESAQRIIDKRGPLRNPADRDHCLQYMVAVALLKGSLDADDYLDEAAADPRIDRLREVMVVEEDPEMSRAYLDPARRAIPNAVTVFFRDGSRTETVRIDYPLGHRRRRREGLPLLRRKLEENLRGSLPPDRVDAILRLFDDGDEAAALPVSRFVDLFLPKRGGAHGLAP